MGKIKTIPVKYACAKCGWMGKKYELEYHDFKKYGNDFPACPQCKAYDAGDIFKC